MKDITIIGAGLVGKSLALALSPLGFEIALLESHLENSRANPSQDRPLSLSYASVEILRSIGIWPSLAETAVPIHEVHVSEQGRFGRMQFSAEEMQVPALGQVVSFSKLQDILFTKISEASNIELVEVTKLNSISQHADKIIVNYSNDAKISARLLLGADGTQSDTRNLLRIPITEKSSDSVALIGHIVAQDEHHFRAYERFTDMGTMALLPLFSKNHFRFVWTLSRGQAETLNPESMRAAFEKSFYNRIEIKDFVFESQFPLKTLLAKEMVKGRGAILGNAAHTFHPIAAQGFNLSLWEVAVLVDLISECQFHNNPLTEKILQDFENAVSPNQNRVVDLTQNISTLFELPFLGSFRGLGMMTTEFLSPIKKRLARQLMGISGKVPKLVLSDHSE